MAPGPILLPPGKGTTQDGGVPKVVYPGGPKPEDYPNLAAYNAAVQKWLTGKMGPTLPPWQVIPNPIGPITGGVKDVAGLISALTNPNTWIRIAEFTVGAILITVGLSKMTGTQGALKTASKAALL